MGERIPTDADKTNQVVPADDTIRRGGSGVDCGWKQPEKLLAKGTNRQGVSYERPSGATRDGANDERVV